MRALSRIGLGLSFLCLPVLAWSADWPQFRGVGRTGEEAEERLPSEWSKDKNVQWKATIPGYAWSAPIVVGDKVFVTTAVSDKQTKPSGGFGGGGPGGFGRPGGPGGPGGRGGFGRGRPAPDAVYKWEVYCLNRADGKVVWKQTAVEKKPGYATHSSNTYATETPVTDGQRVYAYFGMVGVYCFDMTGKKLWEKEIGAYPTAMGFGTGSSPALCDGKVFVQCDNEQKSFLLALDGKTGKELWKVERDDRTSWSTPFPWKNKVRTELVVCGSRKVRSYEPATGKVLWEMRSSGSFSSSPAADDERIYFGASSRMSQGSLYAVKVGASGDVTLRDGKESSEAVAWSRSRSGPSTASPVVYRGQVYVLDRGLSSYDAKTGEPIYSRERLTGARGFTSSPWAYDGKIFCLDEDGRTFVVQAGKEFKVLGSNRIDEMCWSSPAVADGMLLLRGRDHLFCIKK